MKRVAWDLIKSLGLYLLIVVGGVFCFLSLTPLIGYIAYSDRPGPGWHDRVPLSHLGPSIKFLLSWVPLLVPYALAAGLLLFIVARLLERSPLPRVGVAIITALLASFASGYIVAGIGWYIAIADPPVVFAMLLGALFGGWILPRKASR